MSLYQQGGREFPGDEKPLWPPPQGKRCFHCYKPITDEDWIEWLGTGYTSPTASPEEEQSIGLYFHLRCALSFGLRIMRDVWESGVDQDPKVVGR